MSDWAVVAAKEAAVTPSMGIGLLHNIAPGAIDGFAVGILASAICVLVIVTPLLVRRRRHSARTDSARGHLRHALDEAEYLPAPADADEEMFAPDALDEYSTADVGTFSDISDEDMILPGTSSDAGRDQSRWTSYVSKHRMTSPDADIRPEVHRGQPRHAAPSADLGAWRSEEPAA